MKGKKGDEALLGMLAKLAIVLIGGFVIIGAVFLFNNYIKSRSPVETCRLTVFGSGVLRVKEITGINCPKDTLKIKSKDATPTTKYDREGRIRRVIAEHMANCWYKFGEGERTPFAQSILFGKDAFIFGDSYCVVCSELSFDEKLQKEVPSIRDLKGFLQETKISDSLTYFNYLYPPRQDEQKENFDELYQSLDFPDFPTSKKLIVYFALMKSTTADRLLKFFDIGYWRGKRVISFPDFAIVSVRPIGQLPQCTTWYNQPPAALV